MIEHSKRTATPTAVCPWCGYQHESSWEWEQGSHDCHECGQPFEVEKYIECSFNTAPMIPCPRCEKLVALDHLGRYAYHTGKGEDFFTKCPNSRQAPATPPA